jgi:hypothetical protein
MGTAYSVSGLSGVTQMSWRGNHGCAVVSGGSVRCFGRNDGGMLGDGTTVNHQPGFSPVTSVMGLPAARAVATSSYGYYGISCAALVDGSGTMTADGTLIAQNAGAPIVCVYGFTPGVHAPSQTATIDPPTDCLTEDQVLMFEPDGRFTDPDGTFSGVPNAGATLWVADRTLTGAPKYSIVQIYPGGLVRTFEQLE